MMRDVWITKKLFSKGVIYAKVEYNSLFPRMVKMHNGYSSVYINKPHWHTSKEDTLEQAKRMINRERRMLNARLEKLNALEANLVIPEEFNHGQ